MRGIDWEESNWEERLRLAIVLYDILPTSVQCFYETIWEEAKERYLQKMRGNK